MKQKDTKAYPPFLFSKNRVFIVFLFLLFWQSHLLKAQSPGLDSIILVLKNKTYDLNEKMDKFMETGERMRIAPESLDSLKFYVDDDSEDTRLILKYASIIVDLLKASEQGKVVSPEKSLEAFNFFVSQGLYAQASEILHGALYVYQENEMPAEYLHSVKKLIRLCLEEMNDTAQAAHFVGHYFAYHNQKLN